MRPVLGRGAARRLAPGRSRAGAVPPEPEISEERLALQFLAGEPGSLEEVVHRYADVLFREAASRAGRERGEKVVEEAFLRALSHRDEFKPDASLGDWLVVQVAAVAGPHQPQRETSEETDLAPPFALAPRLIAAIEEKSGTPWAGLIRGGAFDLLGKRRRGILAAGLGIAALLWGATAFRRPEGPVPAASEGDGAMAVFFDNSQVVKEAVTPDGRIPVVMVTARPDSAASWRLVSPARGRRIGSALTGLFRLDLDSAGKVVKVRKLFSVPALLPAGTEAFLSGLLFERVPGTAPEPFVEVRVIAE